MAEPLGPGGPIETEIQQVPDTPIDIVELPQQAGIAQMDDGSAIGPLFGSTAFGFLDCSVQILRLNHSAGTRVGHQSFPA